MEHKHKSGLLGEFGERKLLSFTLVLFTLAIGMVLGDPDPSVSQWGYVSSAHPQHPAGEPSANTSALFQFHPPSHHGVTTHRPTALGTDLRHYRQPYGSLPRSIMRKTRRAAFPPAHEVIP